MSSVTQSRYLPYQQTRWSGAVTFDQVDPANGTVVASLSVTGMLLANAWVENMDRAAATIRATDTGNVAIAGLVAVPVVSLSASLSAFDGAVDAAGTSGRFLSGTGSATATGLYGPGASGYQLPIYGIGTFSLPTQASARIDVTGPGNMAGLFQSLVAASVDLTSTSASPPGAPTGGTVGSVIASTPILPIQGVDYVGEITSPTQTVTLAPATTGWTKGLSVAGFDPALGTLLSVNIGLTLTGGGSYDLLNFDPEASSADVSQKSSLTLSTAGGAFIESGSGTSQATVNLPGYTTGAAGTQGTYGAPATTVAGLGSYDPTILAAFTGSGPISLQASGTGATTLDGPGNLGVMTTLDVGGTITVSYSYLPTAGALFDAKHYLAHNPDVAAAGVDPYQHYLVSGWHEGRNPDAFFDTNYYLAQNPDVKAAGVNPLLHYEQSGWKEGRDPSLLFSTNANLAANPSGGDPLQQYEQLHQPAQGSVAAFPVGGNAPILAGGTAAADPLVDAAYYDAQLGATLIPTGAGAAAQAAWSYANGGWQKGLNPDALFDTNYYLSHNPDVAAAGVNPLQHYETSGWKEGRDPSALFSTNKYLAAYGDVKAARVDALLHYVVSGQVEGRTAFHV